MAVNNLRRRLLLHQQAQVAAVSAADGPAPPPTSHREESAARQPVRATNRGAQHKVPIAEPPRPAHWFQAGNSGRPKGAKDKRPRKARQAEGGSEPSS